MRILLADDHAIVRSGLCRIITDAFPDASVDEVGSDRELLSKIGQASWSLLILDVALGNRNSLELLSEIKVLHPNLPIIVLSMYDEKQFVIRALREGASAYLTKDRAPEELLCAIGSVLKGKRYLGENTAQQLADHMALVGTQSSDLHEMLSAREYEVFLGIASGKSVSEVATELGLSVKTVSTYRTRILQKMGMSSNAEIMRYALRSGLVQ
ncbi:MAG: response regulator transcription factor [Deltaproteobacteria bacterium]|nr:response regulator transcription factor [Deltaproteobacteria bacterium]